MGDKYTITAAPATALPEGGPRMTVHQMIAIAQATERCGYCHRGKGQPCSRRRAGVHCCRICLASHHLRITKLDAYSVIDGDVFAGWIFIPDPLPQGAAA